jgi:hypothetical protein
MILSIVSSAGHGIQIILDNCTWRVLIQMTFKSEDLLLLFEQKEGVIGER